MNFLEARGLLASLPSCQVLSPGDDEAVPFSLVLLFDSEVLRNRAREFLVKNRVFPATLWDLDRNARFEVGSSLRGLARRMLSLHCDMRYGPSDMLKVCELMKRASLGN